MSIEVEYHENERYKCYEISVGGKVLFKTKSNIEAAMAVHYLNGGSFDDGDGNFLLALHGVVPLSDGGES